MPKKTPSPFDYISSVMKDKENHLVSGKLPINGLNRFMLNRGCMLHTDSIFAAEMANKLTNISDDAVFAYLHAEIQPKRPRWGKFPKQKKLSDDKEAFEMAEALSISPECARQAIETELAASLHRFSHDLDDDIPF